MARSFVVPLTSFLLIVLLFVSPPTTKAAVDDTLVVDTDGNPLEINVPYHITSFIFNRGFINFPIRMRSNCLLLNMALAPINHHLGRVQIFSPKNSTQKHHISLVQELQIFGEPVRLRPPMYCKQPTGWKLMYDRPTATFVLSFGGDKKSSDSFRMVAVNVGKEVAYKIEVVCPKGFQTPICGHLGYVSENGRKFLGMTQLPELFVFKKAAFSQYY